MNFSPFGGHFPIHQFAAKFNHDSVSLCSQDSSGTQRYTANGIPSFTQHHPPQNHQNLLNSSKFPGSNYDRQNSSYSNHSNVRPEKRQMFDQQELAQELCAAMLQQSQSIASQQQEKDQANSEKVKQDNQQDLLRTSHSHHQQQQQARQSQILQQQSQSLHQQQQPQQPSMSPWQPLVSTGSSVADYLSHLPATATLPISLHHFLKYSAETMKKDCLQQPNSQNPDATALLSQVNNCISSTSSNSANNSNRSGLGTFTNNVNALPTINSSQLTTTVTPPKKKKKRKPEKEKRTRPKPGEIRLTTALDGSTLFCCPECHMAYPEKELLEQHLVGHTLERRFVCDICGAGLKRKDHLTRHKQSHNPERPYVCTVCLKAFKRKEQLTLHFVIHSGEKRHVCTECGKGFYRKDHLRKHTRSHIARRVKAELSQQGIGNVATTGSLALHSNAVTSGISASHSIIA
ncbi:zinc finger and BTB domain-containing protein 49-like [Agrilus planipennis]|uniref:Zinc finger and BTB domain-containing protein 49-like n=1 Tax=Agrilus planipennis TaxID=224129 RepID=A0A7F5R7E8_AGRPL|nr:zinc finger and BTB domain-containing protein 49-like [Agrilus planipennis]